MGSRSVVLTAVLRDSTGNPLSGREILFEYKRSVDATWTNAGSADTDGSGVASVTVVVEAPGVYDFRASFAGDDEYDAASATVTNYTVRDRAVITLTVAPL
ncbi:MAG: Ig-like domain-containing protein [Candidatus Caldarchaeales archaeon]|jgi:hypothetical protein